VDDYTLEVDTNGLDDRTWLGPFGVPHSESLYVVERYHRIDHDTAEFNIYVDRSCGLSETLGGHDENYEAAPEI